MYRDFETRCLTLILGQNDRNMAAQLTSKQATIGYLCIGFSISMYQNVFGALTAFAWTGSIKDNITLLFWWFIVPALIWPWDLFWALFHRLF